MEKTKDQFKKISDFCFELFSSKLEDYGAAWRIMRLPSLTDQIFIKAQRIRSLQQNEKQMIEESQESEFIAIVNYCIIALINIELGVAEKPDINSQEAKRLYKKYAQKTLELMEKKNHDYGEAWREMRVSSLCDIILQKLLRVKQIEDNNGVTKVSEGIDANYYDMLNYAVFSLIKINEQNTK